MAWQLNQLRQLYAVPTGTVVSFAGTVAPAGWLMCDGSTIGDIHSGATFAHNSTRSLFLLLHRSFPNAALRVFSNGHPLTRINAEDDYDIRHWQIELPNLCGRMLVGNGQGLNLTNRLLGQTGGSETVPLEVKHLPSHSHALSSKDMGVHNTAGGMPDGTHGWVLAPQPSAMHINPDAAKIQPTGGNQPHENMPPFSVLNYIIKL